MRRPRQHEDGRTQPPRDATRLTAREIALLVALPMVLLVGTSIVLLVVISEKTDPATRWTAVGAVLAGSGVLAAAVGLPVAIGSSWQCKASRNG